MTLDLLLRNPAPPVTPDAAGWRWLSFSSTTVAGSAGIDTGPDEVCLVNLGGRLSATAGGERFDLGARETPFDALPDALYLPPGTTCTVEEARAGWPRCAGWGRPQRGRRVQPIPGASMRVEVRGSGTLTRQITHIIPPDFAAHRLLVVEVSTPAGNWSSYPPHKHEVERLPIENDLEEVYAYRFAAPEGFGVQRLYPRDGRLEETWTVRDGDVVLVPRGYPRSARPTATTATT